MLSSIILCTDGSEVSVAALRSGLDLLQPAERVVVVTVVETMDVAMAQGASGFAGPVVTEEEVHAERSAALAHGQDVLDATIAALALDEVDARVLQGPVGGELCRLAEDLGARAIVLGTRGRGGVKRALLGSVSDHVVRNAPCPVVVTHHESESD